MLEQMKLYAEGSINGGLVTTVDPADLENNQSPVLKNVSVRYDNTARRWGTKVFGPTPPDTNPVLALAPFGRFDQSSTLLRFTRNSISIFGSSSWQAVTPTPALVGTDYDYFSTAVVNDRFFFSNRGKNTIMEVTGTTAQQLGNAPAYKFIAGFNNRLVGAYLVGGSPNPVQFGWCADGVLNQWDPLADFTAGSVPLIESPSDYSDTISGLVGLDTRLIVMRERSIWQVMRQPSGSNPFAFMPLIPNYGSNAPGSVVGIPNGVCWYDARQGSVFVWTLYTTTPERIGLPVENSFSRGTTDPSKIFASYNTLHGEYTLAFPNSTTGIVQLYTYNFITKAWAYSEMSNVTCISDIDYATTNLLISDLVGPISGLSGNINQLTATAAVASRMYGNNVGQLLQEDSLTTTDNGTTYQTVVQSKIFEVPAVNEYIARVRVEYRPQVAGAFTLQWSKDGGNTWNTYKTVTFTNSDIGQRKLVTCSKNINAREFQWQLVSTSGLFDLIEYEVHTYPGSFSRN